MRPPPPAALARAKSLQSDRLLGLLALAKRICCLAADIERIDRGAGRARIVPSFSFRNAAGPSGLHSSTLLLCDLMYPKVSALTCVRANKAVPPRIGLRQGFSQLRQLRLPSKNAASMQPRRYLQTRDASTAAVSAKLGDTHVNQHSGSSSFSQNHLPLPADSHLQPTPDHTSPFDDPAGKFSGSLDHWLSPWQAARRKVTHKDKQMKARITQVLDDFKADFAPGWRERSDTNGLNRRRLAAHRLWRVYQTYAHKERLPSYLRVNIANALVLSAHYITTNKSHSPQSKALRHLLGRRISAIIQDCNYVRAKKSPATASRSSSTKHLEFTVSMLQPISLALQAQPISALKLMDEVLLCSRPDVYSSKSQHNMQTEYLSPIHTTLLTILDSINFEVNCRPNAETLANSILSQPHFFEDDGMLADLQMGQEPPSESGNPIEKILEWIVESPHAFLFSHHYFRGARTLFFQCLSQARDPHHLLELLSRDRDPAQPGFLFACELLLRSVLRNSPEAALELYDDLWSRGIDLPDSLVQRLIKESGGQAPAARLEALLHRVTNTKSEGQARVSVKVLRSVAISWAIRNRTDRVMALLAHLKRRSTKGHDEFSQKVLAELAAARGDVQSLHEQLAEKYDFQARNVVGCAAGKVPLDGKAYALLIKSCNRSDDVDLAEFYLAEALERGIPLRPSDFNLVIDMHIRKTNVDAALAIFEQMKEFGAQPDTYTYTILIHGFALRRDPECAAHALRAMIAAHKTPDRITYAALLNCFVESGLYETATHLFAWMQGQRDVRIRPTIEVCNIILKAYVLSRLPVQKVMRFVDRVCKLGLLPNANTYALMMQSACDAGLMDVAEEVFSEAESALPNLAGAGIGQGANVYHFTIMIHGYLRLGNHAEAKDYFDEMQSRKLTPSAITWSVMVHSYAHSENEANYDLACNLVSQLVTDETKRIFRPSSWETSSTRTQLSKVQKADRVVSANKLAAKHSAPFETLYTVLMVAQAHRGEPENVEQTLQTMLRHMPRLSVPVLTPLLDAYRRAGDIDSALGLFDQIYESALRSSRSNSRRVYAYSQSDSDDAVEEQGSASQALNQRRQDASSRNQLCLPISIMIDLLSSAGRHEEIAKMWARAKNDGFGFDSDNWNHLAASMARAGQLEEALSVVEHVLYRNPPNAWMRSRLHADVRDHGAVSDAAGEAQVNELASGSDEEELGESECLDRESQEAADFDFLPANTLLDPAVAHRPDATSAPADSLSRRHENRTDDDPYVDLPFERSEPSSAQEDASEPDPMRDLRLEESYTEPSAFYLDSSAKLPYKRDLVSNGDSFSPWYAHFATMEAISRGLANLREASKVITLLDTYRTAADLLDLHERKVEIIRERQKDEAVRSARDLIDGRR